MPSTRHSTRMRKATSSRPPPEGSRAPKVTRKGSRRRRRNRGRVSQPGRDVLSGDRGEIEEAVMSLKNLERRWGWKAIVVCAGLALALPTSRAEDKVDEAMAKATQYLMSTQDPSSGGIHNKMRHETAMTSLAVLAVAACGHQAADPTPEGESMREALGFVLRPEAPEKGGYFWQSDGSR